MVVLFVVLMTMSINWFFALYVIIRGTDMSPRAEKVVRPSVFHGSFGFSPFMTDHCWCGCI